MELERDERGEPATNRVNYTAYRLGRALDRFTENLALAHGVTLSQFLVLQVLGEGLPLSNAQLGRRTFVSSQAAHLVANELLELGLVERGSHPTNRRIRLVQLTEAGWDVVQAWTQELRDHEQRLTGLIGEATRSSASWTTLPRSSQAATLETMKRRQKRSPAARSPAARGTSRPGSRPAASKA